MSGMQCPAYCVKTEHDWNIGMNPTSASDWFEVVLVLLTLLDKLLHNVLIFFQSILYVSAYTTAVDVISRFNLTCTACIKAGACRA